MTDNDWQANFASATTGIAFSLQLSANMAALLPAIESGSFYDWTGHDGRRLFHPTFGALQRRGLAEHNPAWRAPNCDSETLLARKEWSYRLTPAGEHVLALLRLAGVVAEAVKEGEAA